MVLEYLREFEVLAETLNFARTAEQLFTSQSTISKHLKSLEQELGVSLFTRTSRKVWLNENGKLFLPYAKRMLQIQYEYETALYNKTKTEKITLSIGSIPVMAQYQITDSIVEFKQENKGFHLNIIEGETGELTEALMQGQCELAFIRDGIFSDSDQALVRLPYYKDVLTALLPKSHPKSGRQSIRLEELSQEDFILMKENTFLYQLSIDACIKAGFTPNIVFTGHRMENIMDLVAKEMGVALLMKCQTLHSPSQQISIVQIQPPITNQISLVYQKNKKLSPAAIHFIKCVKHGRERSGNKSL